MLLRSPPGKSFAKAMMGGSFKAGESVQPGLAAPSASAPSGGMCFSALCSSCFPARNGTGFLCLMQADRFRSARVCPAWDRHRAIRPCGTSRPIVVDVVVVHVAVIVDRARVVSVVCVRRTEPPHARARSFYNPVPVYDESLSAYTPNRFLSLFIHAPSRF